MRDILLFVGGIPEGTTPALRQGMKKLGKKYRIGIIRNEQSEKTEPKNIDLLLIADFTKPLSIAKALFPYEHELAAITCRGDARISTFRKIIPHVPYLKTPTTESLLWATDKLAMRRRLRAYDRKLTPKFMVIGDEKKTTVKAVREKIGFPVIVKPTGLASSMLVTICYHEEEFSKTIRRVLRTARKAYRDNKRDDEPQFLVEQFMEGEMYSIDAYVSGRGTVYPCPLVHVKTGQSIGFDDFFGYRQLTPVKLKSSVIEDARAVTRSAIHALALRSVTAHVELMRTEGGWKVIELGPRLGGFRHDLYMRAFGINHAWNDILIRLGKKPVIPMKVLGHSAAMKFFARTEGRLAKLKGVKKIETMKPVVLVQRHKKVGEQVRFAKNGGRSVMDAILFHKQRAQLLAAIRRVEQKVKIEVGK